MLKSNRLITFQAIIRWGAFLLAVLISIIVILFACSNLISVEGNSLAILGVMSWAVIGPHLVFASLLAVVLAAAVLAIARRPYAYAALALALTALLSSAWITGTMIQTAYANGGSANLFAALVPASSEPLEPDITETYKVADGIKLQALVYKPSRQAGNAPVIMYIHGGGWVGGAASDWASNARWYAEQGWLVISVDYRLATSRNAAWNKAPADVACALAWTAENAANWGGDKQRLIIMGDSAGGNLALNLAWSAARRALPSECPALGEVPVPNAVVVSYPVANPGYTYEHGGEWLLGQRPQDFTEDYIGGTPARYPDRLAAISPLTYASASVPPTLIFAAERDDFIPAEGTCIVASEAVKLGADVTLQKIPYTHHAFDVFSGTLGNLIKRSMVADYLASQDLIPD